MPGRQASTRQLVGTEGSGRGWRRGLWRWGRGLAAWLALLHREGTAWGLEAGRAPAAPLGHQTPLLQVVSPELKDAFSQGSREMKLLRSYHSHSLFSSKGPQRPPPHVPPNHRGPRQQSIVVSPRGMPGGAGSLFRGGPPSCS